MTERPRIPTTGMRGGLGRTLLTAFLVLAIVPLSTITWYATRREHYDIQREVTAKLSSVAVLTETYVRRWVEDHSGALALLAALPDTQQNVRALLEGSDKEAARRAMTARLRALLEHNTAFRHLALLDANGQVLVSVAAEGTADTPCVQETIPEERLLTINHTVTIPGSEAGTPAKLVGKLDLCALVRDVEQLNGLGNTGEIYLVDKSGSLLSQGRKVSSPGIEAALNGHNTEGLTYNYAGVPVIGVYRWLPALGMALATEQSQEEAFASTDSVTAAVVGATLVVAMVPSIIAAVVTRQITRPIVQLTESALLIAHGDMEQYVPVKSRDEIGILAYVFNRMAAELKVLYDDLEEKVAQRTALLQKANYQIQRRALQLATTVEVSQAATSILDPEQLLREVVRLVQESFYSYLYVGIYLLDEKGQQVVLKESSGGSKELAALKSGPVPLGDESAVGQAALTGAPRILKWSAQEAEALFFTPFIRAEAALPLKIRGQVIGVLDILSTEEEDFDADDVSVLQNVANQISIALENARAYVTEREAARRLRELDRSKRRFLVNMSHELRTPLTNIIGFSRLMLKGIDGPLTKQQEQDLHIIYHNGQHLLGLINDLLDISQIEAGLMELELREVNLSDLINSVMATASALVRGKEIELHQDIQPALPPVQADATRIRQVLLRLLANAAKFTERGSITVRSWVSDDRVLVSVSDTGIGIPPEDQERIFEQFEQGSMENGRRPEGAGLGLALSKEFIEMHGGHIWVESQVGLGSTFTFSLPLRRVSSTGGENGR
ncbi:MAG: ATP-binding protein [Anaerolineae bacterium]|nr:ATP-binding protein [Anaerolineae bacterium]